MHFVWWAPNCKYLQSISACSLCLFRMRFTTSTHLVGWSVGHRILAYRRSKFQTRGLLRCQKFKVWKAVAVERNKSSTTHRTRGWRIQIRAPRRASRSNRARRRALRLNNYTRSAPYHRPRSARFHKRPAAFSGRCGHRLTDLSLFTGSSPRQRGSRRDEGTSRRSSAKRNAA